MPLKNETVREAIIDVLISAAEAQLRTLRQLRKQKQPSLEKRRSNLDLVEDILRREGVPLHVKDIIEHVERVHQVSLDRESIVSSLTKKVHRRDRFRRTAPNTFALSGE